MNSRRKPIKNLSNRLDLSLDCEGYCVIIVWGYLTGAAYKAGWLIWLRANHPRSDLVGIPKSVATPLCICSPPQYSTAVAVSDLIRVPNLYFGSIQYSWGTWLYLIQNSIVRLKEKYSVVTMQDVSVQSSYAAKILRDFSCLLDCCIGAKSIFKLLLSQENDWMQASWSLEGATFFAGSLFIW